MKFVRLAIASLLLIAVFAFCNAGSASAAGDAAPKDTVISVSKELICDCPDCGGQSLDQCTKCSTGQKYRDVVAAQLKEGKSREQIITFFANTYGEHMLGKPRPRGFNRSATLLPMAAALIGLIPLTVILRKRRKLAPAPQMAKASSPSPQRDIEDPRVTAALKDLNF